MMFHNVKHPRRHDDRPSKAVHHTRERENPFPIYLSLILHSHARNRELIDSLHSYGICIGYNRLLGISTELANRITNFYHDQNLVCPPHLRSGCFTTGAMDNNDHNTSSRSSKDSFHGTAISLTQHPSSTTEGAEIGFTAKYDNTTSTTRIRPLPSEYAEVPPAGLDGTEYHVPQLQGDVHPGADVVVASLEEEDAWIEYLDKQLAQAQMDTDANLSWAVYHTSKAASTVQPKCINVLLPLFHKKAHTVAMVCHSMTLVSQVIQHLNPGQIPVITMDQPLYALTKQIQWRWPESFGENSFVVILGGLHIEMALYQMLGDSRWMCALTIHYEYSHMVLVVSIE